jgi:peptidoglycan/xylan/chitin deacetylase (PgdA/CDA1 family)
MSKRKKLFLWSVFTVGFLGSGFWWNEYRTEPIRDLVNPMYWVRRWRQEDLYDANTRILRHGNRNLKEIALTIDDGPHSQTGDQLLDVFKRYQVPVTFFVVGSRMEERPDLVKRMLDEGHEVANHSQNHYRLDTLPAKQVWREINDCDIHFCRITGRHFSLLRPPGVRYNDLVLRTAKDLDYVVISWSDAAKDFLDVSPDFIVNRVLKRAENGSIILLHDDRPATVAAMPRILSALQRDGYKFVTVSEMLNHLPKPVVVQTNSNRPSS